MRFKSVLSALGIAMAIVISLDYVSVAATGKSFLLGRTNSSAGQTTLTRTKPGTTLPLTARTGSAPLKVSGTTKATNLNADLLDGLDSSALSTRREPLRIASATPIPSRTVELSTDSTHPTSVLTLPLVVPAECGAATRHTYLVEQEMWFWGSGIAELSLTVDSTTHQFGPGTAAIGLTELNNSATSRSLVLSPGAHTVRVLVNASATSTNAYDPALRAIDLGYDCSAGPVTRPNAGRLSSRPGGVPGR